MSHPHSLCLPPITSSFPFFPPALCPPSLPPSLLPKRRTCSSDVVVTNNIHPLSLPPSLPSFPPSFCLSPLPPSLPTFPPPILPSPSLLPSSLPPPSPSQRYGELCFLALIRYPEHFIKPVIRDTALLRFMHSLLVSAPLIVIQLYIAVVTLYPSDGVVAVAPLYPADSSDVHTATWAALGAGILSLLYTILVFTTSDRFSASDRRHSTLPAHVLLTLWYVSVIAARILALSVFAYVYGPYVLAVFGGHWLLSFLGLLCQKTTFFNSADGRRRLYLEVPLDAVAALMFEFVFFNLKSGRMWFWLLAYHLLVFVENGVMSALCFLPLRLQYFWSAVALLALVMGLTVFGVVVMVVYYVVFHPTKTGDWFWLGCPKRNGGCCSRAERLNLRQQTHVISQPTSVQHVTGVNGGFSNRVATGSITDHTHTRQPVLNNGSVSGFQSDATSQTRSLIGHAYLRPPTSYVLSDTHSGTDDIDGSVLRPETISIDHARSGVDSRAYTITASESSHVTGTTVTARHASPSVTSADTYINSPLPNSVLTYGEERAELEQSSTETGTVERTPSPYDHLSSSHAETSGAESTLPRSVVSSDQPVSFSGGESTLPRSIVSSDLPMSFSDSTGTGNGSPGHTPLPPPGPFADDDDTPTSSPSPPPLLPPEAASPSSLPRGGKKPKSVRAFLDIPAKRQDYVLQRSSLEQYYFPDAQSPRGGDADHDSKTGSFQNSPSHVVTCLNGQPQWLKTTPTHSPATASLSTQSTVSPSHSYGRPPSSPSRSPRRGGTVMTEPSRNGVEGRLGPSSRSAQLPPRNLQPYAQDGGAQGHGSQSSSGYSSGKVPSSHGLLSPRRSQDRPAMKHPPPQTASLSQPESSMLEASEEGRQAEIRRRNAHETRSYRDVGGFESTSPDRMKSLSDHSHLSGFSDQRNSSLPNRTRSAIVQYSNGGTQLHVDQCSIHSMRSHTSGRQQVAHPLYSPVKLQSQQKSPARINGTSAHLSNYHPPPPRSPRKPGAVSVSESTDAGSTVVRNGGLSRHRVTAHSAPSSSRRPLPPHLHPKPHRYPNTGAFVREQPHSASLEGGRDGLLPSDHASQRREDQADGAPYQLHRSPLATQSGQRQDQGGYWKEKGVTYAKVHFPLSKNPPLHTSGQPSGPGKHYQHWNRDHRGNVSGENELRLPHFAQSPPSTARMHGGGRPSQYLYVPSSAAQVSQV